MLLDTLRRLLIFVVLCLAQVLVLGRIQLFHCAIPLLYVYFVLMFPRNYPRWAILLWNFCLGLVIDIFANTPGVASASMTLIGLLQPYLLELFLPRDAEEHQQCSAKSLGWGKFAVLAVILVVIYCLVFFLLESFSFADWLFWLECAGGSSLITLILIFTLESVRK